jgi:hypothetical protein
MTAQACDRISYDGTLWVPGTELLRLWLSAHPDVREAFHDCFHMSTAHRRGYLASWAVVDGELLLAQLRSPAIERPQVLEGKLPLSAGWVYGEIHLLTRVDNRDLSSNREATIAIIDVEGGRVRSGRRMPTRLRFTPIGDWWHGQGSLRPWPGSAIPPEQQRHSGFVVPPEEGADPQQGPRTVRARFAAALDDKSDQWGLHTALMQAGCRSGRRGRRWFTRAPPG